MQQPHPLVFATYTNASSEAMAGRQSEQNNAISRKHPNRFLAELTLSVLIHVGELQQIRHDHQLCRGKGLAFSYQITEM